MVPVFADMANCTSLPPLPVAGDTDIHVGIPVTCHDVFDASDTVRVSPDGATSATAAGVTVNDGVGG